MAKKVTVSLLTVEKFLPVLKESFHGDDRTMAIMCAALLEDALEQLLRAQLRQSKVSDRLFVSEQPLGSFAAKISIAFATGMIGDMTHEDLVRIKDIRNIFAHHILLDDEEMKLNPVSFTSQAVRDISRQLKFPSFFSLCESDPKKRYQFTCLVILARFHFALLNRKEKATLWEEIM